MSAVTVRSRMYRIAGGLRCCFTHRKGTISVECHWHPDPPKRLTGKALRNYRAARREFVESIANGLAGDCTAVVVVETFDLTPSQVRDLALGLAPVGGNA